MLNMLSIGLEEAETIIAAASTAASAMNVPQNIAVVDAAGHLVAFRRMDGAKFSSIDIALAKAYTAAGARKATGDILPATLPGQPGFGLQSLNGGRLTTLGGGVPLEVDGQVVGAIGVSSGSVDQDRQVAEAGARAFRPIGG
ncbi:hypothetical protein DEVEQU_00131 [Devosia equisanguinis]|uniref:Heme-binding protein n=1 Tax=Devosia equisanguinis TaxID=2490941 RepID=A0A3S4CAV0_9HYPH|nr:heme-binding protein [Devosia equisanguinis]VDS03011.1 hypothetical protein DEVEQU_00131 [Devosia equisanguinis]